MIGGVNILNEDWGKAKSKIKQVSVCVLFSLVPNHWSQNSMFLMMGSVDELPSAPKEKTKFIEDMTEEDAAATVSLSYYITEIIIEWSYTFTCFSGSLDIFCVQ